MSEEKNEVFERNIIEANAFWLSKPDSKDRKVVIDSNRNWKGNSLPFSKVNLLTAFRDKTNKAIKDLIEAKTKLKGRLDKLELFTRQNVNLSRLNHTFPSKELTDKQGKKIGKACFAIEHPNILVSFVIDGTEYEEINNTLKNRNLKHFKIGNYLRIKRKLSPMPIFVEQGGKMVLSEQFNKEFLVEFMYWGINEIKENYTPGLSRVLSFKLPMEDFELKKLN